MASVTPDQELEVKFFDINLETIRSRLASLGASLKTPNRLMRRVVFGGEANPSMLCTYGRVRDEGDVVTMSAKYSAVNGDIASQKEAMVTVDSFESALSVLESFGLTVTNYQESKRETWQMTDGTLVELEEWPQLPTYIEIEGASIDAIQACASQLELDWATHTTVTTGELYRQHFSLDEAATQQKIADLRFTA